MSGKQAHWVCGALLRVRRVLGVLGVGGANAAAEQPAISPAELPAESPADSRVEPSVESPIEPSAELPDRQNVPVDMPTQVVQDKAEAARVAAADNAADNAAATDVADAADDADDADDADTTDAAASTFVDGQPHNAASATAGTPTTSLASTFVDGRPTGLESIDLSGSTNVDADSADASASTFVDGVHVSTASTNVDAQGDSSSHVSAATPVDSPVAASADSPTDSPADSSAEASANQPAPAAPITPTNPIAAPTTPDPEHSANPNAPTLPPHYTPLPLTTLITPNPEGEPPTLATWEHILGTDPEGQAERQAERRETRRSNFFGILSILLITVSALVIGTPFAMRAAEQRQANNVSNTSAKTVAGWPYPKAKEALAAARAYNKRLAQTSQSVIGEAHDPFASESGGSKTSNESNSLAAKDKEYQSLLNTGEGVMGTIRIPKISVKLPIYHGTSEDALARGVGHLYGTSLPAGGKNTHTVLTGHRGLVNAELFTRLDELRKGDYIYLEIMGETFGYKVDRISVIEPSDVSKLKVEPGKDRITLMTCTPYGVNTHRLLVSGLRGKIPHPIPDPNAAPKDVRAIAVRVGLVAGGGVLAVWLWLGLLNPKRDQWMLIQHAASRPDWL